jgi:hypothetical protein
MRWFLLTALGLFSQVALAGEQVLSTTNSVGMTGRTGEQVAEALTRRYKDLRGNCGADSKPAFLCSGIVLRGTADNDTYDFWEPSPTQLSQGSVSFSYLRGDFNLIRLANHYQKGFIFYPVLDRPADKLQIEVLCFFPVDGKSDSRVEQGCGAVRPGETVGKRCAEQTPVVRTAQDWVRLTNERPGDMAHRCSFDVRDTANTAAGPAFKEGLRVAEIAKDVQSLQPNDLKLELWQTGDASQPEAKREKPRAIPIEAIVRVSDEGLAGAQRDQRRWREMTGFNVPIIKMSLPAQVDGQATFSYLPSDQVVAPY